MPTFEHSPSSTFNSASLAAAALAYAAAGIPVLPLRPREKQPIVRGGFKSATTNAFLIRRWWRDTPLANIGVACGEPSGWWVLDIDPRHDGLTSLVQLQHDVDQAAGNGTLSALLFATRRQLTGGGGAHLFFRRCTNGAGKVTTTTNWAGYAGIDIRAEHSYIMVAPSIHPQGGIYQWQNDLPLVPFPAALVTLGETRQAKQHWRDGAISTASQHAGQEMRRNEPHFYLQHALSQAIVGQRNRFACYLACRLVEDVGLDWDGAVPWMLDFVSHVSQADHAYTEREALSALAWAFRQAQAA